MTAVTVAELRDKVVEQFEGHPERWTQRTSARTAEGTGISWQAERAVSFCVMGMSQKVGADVLVRYAFYEAIDNYVGSYVAQWNDSTDFPTMLATLKALPLVETQAVLL